MAWTLMTCWGALALAQQDPEGAAPEPSMVDIPSEANSIQQATMSYGSGQRALKKHAKLTEKADAASGTDREKFQSKAREQLEKAVQDFATAINFNPKLHKAYVALGDTLVMLDQYQDAVGVYSQAIELEPADWGTVLSRGRAMVAVNNIQGAVDSYQVLRNGDVSKADELLATIKGWVEDKQANPGQIPADAIKQVEDWVVQQEGSAS
ncbi:MAG: hypothetical protein P8Y44_07500 [Acidobacteriota bacterium]